MRIDDLNSVTSVNACQLDTAQVKDTAKVRPEKADGMGTDRVELSTRKAEIEKLAGTAAQIPDVRSEKVAALKQQISDGTYKVEGLRVAEKMLEHFKGSKGAGGSE